MSYNYHLAFPKGTHQVTEILLSMNSLHFCSVILIQSQSNTTSRIPSTTGNSFVYLFIPRSANYRFLSLTFFFHYLLSKPEDSCYYTIPASPIFFSFSPPPPSFTMIYRYFLFYFVYHLPTYGRCWILVVVEEWDPARDDSQSGVVPALRLPLGHWAGSKGQGGLPARRLLWTGVCEGQARPDGDCVLFLPPFPITGGRMAESSGPSYRILRRCSHPAACVGDCWVQPHVALMWHHPSTEQRWLCALTPQGLKPTLPCKSSCPRVKERWHCCSAPRKMLKASVRRFPAVCFFQPTSLCFRERAMCNKKAATNSVRKNIFVIMNTS